MSAGLHNVLDATDSQPLVDSNHETAIHNGHSNDVNGHVPVRDTYRLGNFAIDEARPMKIVIIGAGFAGITAGIRFAQKIKNINLTIYEKLGGPGGTWYANKYPGLSCDIPSHCYQLTFEEKTDWSSFYAPGAEIQGYLQGVIDKYKLTQYLKLRHELVHARYIEEEGKWHLKIRRPASASESEDRFEEFEDTADFVFGAFGLLSRWSMPDIPGLEEYKGKLIHSADWEGEPGHWPETVKDWSDKTVAVIGVGSSAIQIVPALQPRVKKLYNYVRGKTWLSTSFVADTFSRLLEREPDAKFSFTEDEKTTFSDPEYYKKFRHDIEAAINSLHSFTRSGDPMSQGAAAAFRIMMAEKLAKKPWILDHLLPDFSVGCRRLTPGPGYLEALCEDNVDYIPSGIKRITATGIETEDGQHIDLDVIICATGYDPTWKLHFPVIGRSGRTLDEAYTPYPRTYLSACTSDFPNLFFATGPNSGVGSGSLLIIIEKHVEYAVKVVQKMQRERLKSIEVKEEAVQDYDEYIDNYFPTTVFGEKCRSWYKLGKEEGRVVGLWPGSCLHAVRALEYPRWEDYNYEYLDPGVKNRFYWLGDGSTYNEKYMVGDRAWYLNDEALDIPPIPVVANGIKGKY